MSDLLLRRAEVDGEIVDVAVAAGCVERISAPGRARRAETVVDCDGGALLPGLHDHHLHLLAMAAADRSVDVAGADLDAVLAAAHRTAPSGRWLRAVGYDDAAAGRLDRWRLDRAAPGRPVRVQHRSGALWVLSSAALDAVGAAAADHRGIERAADGTPTGRLFRADGWLGARLPPEAAPDLAAVGRRLRKYGVTGATDCTPTADVSAWAVLAAAVRAGDLPLEVVVTGAPALAATEAPAPLGRGPVKVVLADHDLPPLDVVVGWYRTARAAGRAVAVHCVTRTALAVALAAWGEVGAAAGDRVEHASVAGVDAAARLAELGVAVVTQPAFIAARGDAYRREVHASDLADLYRCASLLAAHVAVGGSTDAPYGPEDPWVAIAAAADRMTATGAVVGPGEAVDPRRALELFLAPLASPGGAPRRVAPGAAADLCLLDRPLGAALAVPSSHHVRATFAAADGRRS